LFARGFSVLARNLRLGVLEIDIVARSGSLVVVVEVRTRGQGSFVGAFESVTPTKRANLTRAVARLWRATAGGYAGRGACAHGCRGRQV
jgi:putative endonuclease